MTRAAALVALCWLAAAPIGVAGGLYRWVDKNGAVHYTDTMPPEAAGWRQDQLDNAGRVLHSTQANETPASIAAEEARKREAEKQANYDHYLSETYATVDQIIAVRDDRLGMIDKHLKLAEQMRSKTQGELDALNARADEIKAKGKVLDQGLAHQIDAYKSALETDQRSVNEITQQRATVAERYQHDIDRWQTLHARAQSP